MEALELSYGERLAGFTDDELLAADAELGKQDLYHLITRIIGFHRSLPDGTIFQMAEEEHRPICDFLSSPWPKNLPHNAKRFMCLIQPRGTLKTVTAMGLAVQAMIRNPNIAELWCAEKKDYAIEPSRTIKEVVQNDEFIARYGDWKGPGRVWRDKYWTISTRTTSRKDPTFATSGVGVSVQGRHPDLIICDDLQGLTNLNDEGIKTVKKYLRHLTPVLNPGGTLVWLCTRWALNDAASEIIERALKGMGWEMLPSARGYLGAYAVPGDEEMFRQPDGSCHFVPGEPIFRSVLDEQAIQTYRREMTPFEFSCQILNDPLPEHGALFKQSYLRYVEDWAPDSPTDHPSFSLFQGLTYVMIVSPANAQESAKGADDVILVLGYRATKHTIEVTVVESHGSNTWKPDELIDRIFLVSENWKPSKIYVEGKSLGKWIKQYLEFRMRESSTRLPVDEFEREQTKISRIENFKAIQPFFRSGMVRQFRSMQKGRLDEQLLRITEQSTSYDQWAYALAIGIRLIAESPRAKINKKNKQPRKFRHGNVVVGRW